MKYESAAGDEATLKGKNPIIKTAKRRSPANKNARKIIVLLEMPPGGIEVGSGDLVIILK